MNPEKYEDVLMRVLKFNENDLTLNREGKLSDSQTARLKRQRIYYGSAAAIFLVVFVGGFIALLPVLSSSLLAVFAILGICAFALYMTGMPAYRVHQDITENCVMMTEGQAWVREKEENILFSILSMLSFLDGSAPVTSQTVHLMQVGGVEFEISGEAAKTIKTREKHRVFYVANSNQILSAEILP